MTYENEERGRWKIGKHEFYMAYHFAMQYQEWKDQLSTLTDSVGAIVTDGMPHGKSTGNPTQSLAIRRAALDEKIKVVEDTAREATEECEWMFPYLIRAVTDENVTFDYLRKTMGIPCGKNKYYTHRRKFYYILSKKI